MLVADWFCTEFPFSASNQLIPLAISAPYSFWLVISYEPSTYAAASIAGSSGPWFEVRNLPSSGQDFPRIRLQR
jgi:hypothetical protein